MNHLSIDKRVIVGFLRLGIVFAALDLVLILSRGSYVLPILGIKSMHPATSVIFLLVFTLLQSMVSPSGPVKTYLRTNTAIFLLIWIAFQGNFRWRGSGDVVAASLQPFALLRSGNLYLDDYYKGFLQDEDIRWVYHRNNHVMSMYSSAPGLLLVPVYLIPALAGAPVTDLLIHQLQKIGASFMVALSEEFQPTPRFVNEGNRQHPAR